MRMVCTCVRDGYSGESTCTAFTARSNWGGRCAVGSCVAGCGVLGSWMGDGKVLGRVNFYVSGFFASSRERWLV